MQACDIKIQLFDWNTMLWALTQCNHVAVKVDIADHVPCSTEADGHFNSFCDTCTWILWWNVILSHAADCLVWSFEERLRQWCFVREVYDRCALYLIRCHLRILWGRRRSSSQCRGINKVARHVRLVHKQNSKKCTSGVTDILLVHVHYLLTLVERRFPTEVNEDSLLLFFFYPYCEKQVTDLHVYVNTETEGLCTVKEG